MAKKLYLTRGKFTLVDDDMFNYLNQWKWQYSTSGYAVRTKYLKGGKGKLRNNIWLHHLILTSPKGKEIDHIDHDPLNNQRANLRLATRAENQHNRLAYGNNTSGYKGVTFHKTTSKWRAQIVVDNKKIYLGIFDLPTVAAAIYNKAAKKYHKEFASINNL